MKRIVNKTRKLTSSTSEYRKNTFKYDPPEDSGCRLSSCDYYLEYGRCKLGHIPEKDEFCKKYDSSWYN